MKIFTSVALVLVFAMTILADIPQIISYHGKLTGTTGIGENDTLPMTFKIYDVETDGSPLWTETHDVANEVPVVKGLFDVALGSVIPIDLPFDVQYWLEIEVEGNVLTPRVKLTASPYALNMPDIPDTISKDNSGYAVMTLINESADPSSRGLVINGTTGDGISIQNPGGAGLHIYHPVNDGFYVDSAGGNGCYFRKPTWSGIVIDSAGGDGIRIINDDYPSGHYGIYSFSAEAGDTVAYFAGNVYTSGAEIADTFIARSGIKLGGVYRETWPSGGSIAYCGYSPGATPSTQYGELDGVARCDHTHWGQEWYGDGTALEISANQAGSELHAIFIDAVQNGASSEFRGISSKMTIDGSLGGNAIMGEAVTGSGDGTVIGVRGFASNVNMGSSSEILGFRGIGTGKTNGNIYGGAFTGICDEPTATGNVYGVNAWAFTPFGSSGKTHYGIYAKAADGIINWAGYFDDGDVNIQNTLIFTEAAYGTDSPGLRANTGNLEYRDDGGSWIALNTLGGGGPTYDHWKLQANGGATTDISTGETVNFTGTGDASVSRSGNTITI
ncbi:hypothetical protein J7M07_05905, partial [bacterium]|nr:hypothetical protein [bacterium]